MYCSYTRYGTRKVQHATKSRSSRAGASGTCTRSIVWRSGSRVSSTIFFLSRRAKTSPTVTSLVVMMGTAFSAIFSKSPSFPKKERKREPASHSVSHTFEGTSLYHIYIYHLYFTVGWNEKNCLSEASARPGTFTTVQ